MGFFDKAKSFFGGHGVKLEITRLERQDPGSVTFPITDSVFKGNYRITAEKAATILAHIHEIIVKKKHADGREETIVVGSDSHDAETDIIGCDLKWPYEIAAGQSVEDSFLVSDLDLPKVFRRLGYSAPEDALVDGSVEVLCRITADVKGSPFDAEGIAKVKVVA